jgi:hypothetical protein
MTPKVTEEITPGPGEKMGASKLFRFLMPGTPGAGRYWLVAGLALLVVVVYAGLASATGPGYPLDDSWIHQTYARNMAQTGRWEYVAGTTSAGSTAPLWTLLLAVGYLLRLPHFLWAVLLGWLCLVWISWAAMILWQILWPARQEKAWMAGVVLVLSWPLAWAAGSGMETLLFIALSLQLMVHYGKQVTSGHWHVATLGLLAGLLVLTRPDGLGLLLLVGLGLLMAPGTFRRRLWRLALYIAAASLTMVPYFAFNLGSGGNLWPNTFYAKQAEYTFLWDQPLPLRFFQLLYFSLGGPPQGLRGISGAHLLLLPGIVAAIPGAVRQEISGRRLLHTLPLLWAAGHVLLYAWRLPVTYQHGRYIWPVLPVLTLYGLAGWMHLTDVIVERMSSPERLRSLWTKFAALTFATLLLVFLLLGLQVYLQDVALINGEMVDAALWLNENTPSESLVAAHDIGAIGYFSDRSLLDLAGLISPEVIPMLVNNDQIAGYVIQSGADFLVTAPGWPYLELTSMERASLAYSTDFAWTQEQGLNNTTVYKLEHDVKK